MARTDPRSGPQTRNHIATVASRLFLERGFEDVTVAEVAREAGVSSVTVFKHFPKKEDLFFDRSDEAAELLRRAVRDAAASRGTAQSFRSLLLRLVDEGNSFSGTDERSVPFFRAVAQSSTLQARARTIASELQCLLERELDDSPEFEGDSALFAAFFIAGYARVLAETANRLVQGEPRQALVARHRDQIEHLIEALQHGAAGP